MSSQRVLRRRATAVIAQSSTVDGAEMSLSMTFRHLCFTAVDGRTNAAT
jgi:hypothetical protein